MKFLLIILTILVVNCSSTSHQVKYTPTQEAGCSAETNVKSRLNCIADLVKQLDAIRNATITVSTQEGERIDNEYIYLTETYCFSDPKGKAKYMCFDATREHYDPTFLGKVWRFTRTFGLGLIIGLIGGVAAVG